jgi:hypothetical protein
MAYKVFISYSTMDLPIVDAFRQLLSNADVEVFVAEYSVWPSQQLNQGIEAALRSCDLFVLLWSQNSRASEYVQHEVGVARGCNKTILPVMLQPGLTLPGFVSELKYLPAYQNPPQALAWIQAFVAKNAAQQQQAVVVLVLLALLALVLLMSNDRR